MNRKAKAGVLQRLYTEIIVETVPEITMADLKQDVRPEEECSAALACLIWHLLRRAKAKRAGPCN